jgi:hypothetical protein
MAWTGKLLGGLIGGMVGGPVGVGVGAAVGHALGDSARPLELHGLRWAHHAFGASGPGVRLVPEWRARGLTGRDVAVRLRVGTFDGSRVVVPEARDERCVVPTWLVPYADLADGDEARIDLGCAGATCTGRFDFDLPSPVRRLGNNGPARLVMALLAAARTQEGEVSAAARRFVADTFVENFPLDETGLAWLDAWFAELAQADLGRLSPERVATRLSSHLDERAKEHLLLWLARGSVAVWPGDRGAAYAGELARLLGSDAFDAILALAEGDPRVGALAVLGLSPTATPAEIKARWIERVRVHHPDRMPAERQAEATRRTAELNAAYRILTEP